MDARELGRKIREARLAKRLTQSEVVGDFITRNMLSQIESGTAMPSMKTLEYLSKVLAIPIAQLVPGDDPMEKLTEAKRMLMNGEAGKALALADDLLPELHDESSAIAARAHLLLARELAQHEEYASAEMHARAAAERAQQGAYASADIRSKALLLLDEIGRL